MSKSLGEEELKQVANVKFFKGLAQEDITNLLKNAVVIEEEKGSLLFSQGDPANRFYILLDGRVKLFTANEDGEESIVEIFNPVCSFAEAAMFASGRFPVNCETVLRTRLVRVDGDHFLRSLKDTPRIGQTILKKISMRYRHLLHEIIQLKTQSPAQRLGAFFLSLAEENEDGTAVALPYDKNLIAARVGMKPESLSRALVRLRDIGVDCRKKELIVADLDKLRAFCGESAS